MFGQVKMHSSRTTYRVLGLALLLVGLANYAPSTQAIVDSGKEIRFIRTDAAVASGVAKNQ